MNFQNIEPTESSKTAKTIIVRVVSDALGFWYLPSQAGRVTGFEISPMKFVSADSSDAVKCSKREAELWSVFAQTGSGDEYCIADLPTKDAACALVSMACSLSPDLEVLPININE